MRAQRLLLAACFATAGLLFAAQGASGATATPTFEVRDGGAHCQTGPLGNHWRWDVRIIPGSLATSWSVEAPWTITNVSGPTAGDRLVLHLVSTSPVSAVPYGVTVNGTGHSVTPTLHPNGNCPVPPTTTTQPPTTTTTLPPPTTTTTPTVPPVDPPVVPPTTELGTPLKAVRPAPSAPSSTNGSTQVAARATMPNTGADGPTLIALTCAGVVAIAAGLSALRTSPRRKVGLR